LGKIESAKIYRKQFKTLSFEGVTVSNPVMDLMPDEITRIVGNAPLTGSLIRQSDRGLPDAILGMNVLSKAHIYIAYRERKLYIMAAGDGAPVDTASLTAAAGAAAAMDSGSWKVAAPGIAPLCEIVQTDNELKGTCTGPAAKGELT